MPLRLKTLLGLVVVCACALGAACGGPTVGPNEPTTAAEKQRREAATATGDDKAGKWGGWRYQGDRDDCFFVIGRRCFRTQERACKAAKCAAPKACQIDGGGPAIVSCK